MIVFLLCFWMGKENQLAGLTKNKSEVKGVKVSEMQSAEGRRS